MITGTHAIVFSRDAEATRAFFRDALGLPFVDAGGGWLIFALPPAEIAAHPTEEAPHVELYLMCDDIHREARDLKAKGVEFARPISEESFGVETAIALPGGQELGLYQPTHPSPLMS
jgi:catechol 2,3-dioxygenase-like lactoylglutathione lyase family enzyme